MTAVGELWTPEEKALLCKVRKIAATSAECALVFSARTSGPPRSKAAVDDMRLKLGLHYEPRFGSDEAWTKDAKAQLRRLWNVEGKSASEIASILGCTRNAVIGKAHRMKLKARPSPIKRKGNVLEFKAQGCEWPEGSEAPYTFCGEKRVRGHSYCARHVLLSIRKEHRPALKRALRKAGERV